MAILSNINNLLRISNSTGRVLINSTNAIVSNSEVLTVGGRSSLKNDSSSVAALVIVNEDTTANTFQPYMYFNDGGGNRAGFGVERSTDSLKINAQANIIFSTGATSLGGTERIRINSVGTVGIGPTGTYTNNHILNLSGTGIAIKNDTNGSSNNWSQIKNTAATSGSNLTFLTATGTNVMADNGNLGIGTDSPVSKLDIGTSSGASMQFLYDTSQTYRNNISNYWNSSTDSRMDFNIGRTANVAPATIMSVGYGGNVGIGTTAPTKQLHLLRTTGDVRGIMVETTVATSYAEVQVKAASEFRIGTGGSSTVPNGQFYVYDATAGAHRFDIDANGNVGIGTVSPKAKLDVSGKFCVDSKAHGLTNGFTTCLTINLNSHTGCYVTLTCFGDWGSHSSAAYRGEFFLQNGANAYSEPGIILRQDDNTSNGNDQIVCQIVDPTSGANPKDFEIQIRTTATTGTTSFTGQLTYTVQGQFNSIT